LQIALALSLVAHAGLLALHFVPKLVPERVLREQPLAVVLVNAQDEQPPTQAQAIAQASLAGGGTAAGARSASPLPEAERSQIGGEDEADAASQAHSQAALPLLASLRLRDAALPASDPHSGAAAATDQASERRRRQLLSLLAEVEQRVNAGGGDARQRYIGAATREEVYARYYGELRRRIEERGTAEFPEAGGHKLYGELTMLMTVDHEGRVRATEVVQGSGSEALDLRAQALVRSMNFGRFEAALRERADQVVVASRFRFTRGAAD
jgi:protein TonB